MGNKQAAKPKPTPKPDAKRAKNVIVIGGSGVGKSSLCKLLSSSEKFKVSHGMVS